MNQLQWLESIILGPCHAACFHAGTVAYSRCPFDTCIERGVGSHFPLSNSVPTRSDGTIPKPAHECKDDR